MRRHVWAWIACGAIFFHGGCAKAQDSLKALEDELNVAKQAHEDITSQTLTNFFGQLNMAMGSPDAAVALYVQARSAQPDFTPPDAQQGNDSTLQNTLLACGITPSPVITEHESESATEKDARLARDQANLTRLGVVLQLHCGLMNYAALFVTQPNQKGLQDQWVAWLKSAAQVYPQLSVPGDTGNQPPPQHHKKKNPDDAEPPAPPKPPPPFYPSEMKAKAMQDSIISKFLGFNVWGDKEQGGWAVHDLPKLYRTNVLEPLRTTPTADTLAAWDAYIAMANADEPNNDKWNQVVYPPLQFDRACDDYAVTPGTDKLESLVNLIKANPTYPKVDDWIARTKQLMDDYSARRNGGTQAVQNPAPPSGATNNPNVSITTVQQGDETIIITHTNSAPVAPAH